MTTLIYISSLSVIIPFAIGVSVYKSLPDPARVITWLLGAWLLSEGAAQFVAWLKYPNWHVFMLLSGIELILVSTFFRKIFVSKIAGMIATWSTFFGMILTIEEFIRTGEPMGTLPQIYDCLFFFGMGLYYFYEVTAEDAPNRFNWITSAIMVMFVGSAAYFGSWELMKDQHGLFRMFGAAHAVLLVICYSLFTVGLWRLRSSS
jgi:hypothetical protein